ncbi:MAG: hypothetical protein J6T03_05430, partial [Bacteroidales bacterium]|nr:hypothetical protein [Bacteroidales bacterium]
HRLVRQIPEIGHRPLSHTLSVPAALFCDAGTSFSPHQPLPLPDSFFDFFDIKYYLIQKLFVFLPFEKMVFCLNK